MHYSKYYLCKYIFKQINMIQIIIRIILTPLALIADVIYVLCFVSLYILLRQERSYKNDNEFVDKPPSPCLTMVWKRPYFKTK